MVGRRGRMPRSRNRLRTIRGLILLRPSCQSSSSVSILEMNHPDVRILTIRRYAWRSWPRPVSRTVGTVSTRRLQYFRCKPNCLATSVWRSPASIMPTARHLSVSFNLDMAYQRRFSKLSWVSVLQASTLCLYICLVDKRVCDLTADRKKTKKKTWKRRRRPNRQTTHATHALTSVNDRDGYTTCLCKVSSLNF